MARKRRGRRLNGWIVLDKPEGLTSTRAVAAVKRLFDAAKAGHAGTLDPLATGILPIALGEATKVVARIVDSTKEYRFELRWGEERDTDDADGAVVATSERRPSPAEVAAVLPRFLGEIEQTPPVYSAIKVAGERAYDLAREGRPAELAPRQVRIDRFERLDDGADPERARFLVACGKGAYIRALARDLGRLLDCRAYVSALRRTRVGPFSEAEAISLDNLQALRHKGALDDALRPVEAALADIPALTVTGSEAARLKSGQAVRVPSTMQGTVCAMVDGRPVALALIESGEVRPVRVFNL
ncbi:MAG: tRNA pseudouridine(55) synthase TruB [Alphaproteobacteria bacterium]|jgi:tRNA pseudouridine55 synthase|nr:tRNA pseudouridine(55) synthase TruB [Alphaproteobacteria bacterium]